MNLEKDYFRSLKIKISHFFLVTLFLILSLCFITKAFPQLPDLGSSSSMDLSIGDEKILGSQIFKRIIKSGAILDDAEATDYLKDKLKKIIKLGINKGHITGSTITLIEEFDIFLIKDPQINAFALPGAKIGVHTGLFLDVGSEGELMSVLSHELAHITQRHVARMFGNRKESSALLMAAAILSAMAVSSSNSDAAMGLITLGQGASMQKDLIFSRQAEREADRIGLQFLTTGGYGASEMVNMLERLNSSNILSGQTPSWFSSHPMNYERIAEIKSRIPLQYQYLSKVRAENGEIYRWIKERLKETSEDNSFINLEKNQLRKELLYKGMSPENLYGLFWRALKNKNYDVAQKLVLLLKKEITYSKNEKELEPMVILAEANLENSLKNYSRSIKLIKNFLSTKRSTQTNRALLRLLLKNYIESNELLEADNTARRILEKWPRDFLVWAQRASISDKLGYRVYAHIYSAERYVAMNQWYLAMEQLKLAKKEKNLDFISLSKIDSRLKEIEEIHKKNLNFSNQ